jgi:glutamate-5-semialdehyde dehydrogenase
MISDNTQLALALGGAAKKASRVLAASPGATRNLWLLQLADALLARTAEIEAANAQDLKSPLAAELSTAMRERLSFTALRIASAAAGLRQVAGLPDPVGEVLSGSIRPNGLLVNKIRVPLGVIFFMYESRPNVTLDAAALCIKSGNAVILRGGKEAAYTNQCLAQIITETLAESGLPAASAQAVLTADRDMVDALLSLPQFIDLAIPRGGEALIRRVIAQAKMPVLKHYLGNCHVYVHGSALIAASRLLSFPASVRHWQRPAWNCAPAKFPEFICQMPFRRQKPISRLNSAILYCR